MLPLRLDFSRGKLILVALTLLALLSTSLPSHADQRFAHRSENSRQEQATARISAAQAAELVQRQVGGKVMGVQTQTVNGTVIYSVKILQASGHMRTVNVNGQTGAIMN